MSQMPQEQIGAAEPGETQAQMLERYRKEL
jgi:hypothetical protein